MATSWVLGKVSDALAPTVSSGVASAGSFVGGAVNAVGNSINGVGDGINGSIRRYGDGVKDYGNGLLDWTQAGNVRGQTASNPLGLAGGTTHGKRTVTTPQVYRAQPRPNASKTLMTTSKTATPQKRIEGATPRKALPAPGRPVKKTEPVAQPKKTAVRPSTSASGPNPGAMKKPSTTTTAKPNNTAKKVTAVKPSTTSVPKTAASKPKVQGNPSSAAANPLGLSF